MSFLVPFAVAGLGMGLVFAPMATVAMRNISPSMGGAASGVFNSFRQLGGVIGSAVVGAILQAQLAQALVARAAQSAGQVPADYRQRFLDGFSQASKAGLDVGPTQNAGAQLPSGLPADVARQLQELVHSVFSFAFVDAMRAALAVPMAMLLLAALSTIFIERRRRTAKPTVQEAETLALAS